MNERQRSAGGSARAVAAVKLQCRAGPRSAARRGTPAAAPVVPAQQAAAAGSVGVQGAAQVAAAHELHQQQALPLGLSHPQELRKQAQGRVQQPSASWPGGRQACRGRGERAPAPPCPAVSTLHLSTIGLVEPPEQAPTPTPTPTYPMNRPPPQQTCTMLGWLSRQSSAASWMNQRASALDSELKSNTLTAQGVVPCSTPRYTSPLHRQERGGFSVVGCPGIGDREAVRRATGGQRRRAARACHQA